MKDHSKRVAPNQGDREEQWQMAVANATHCSTKGTTDGRMRVKKTHTSRTTMRNEVGGIRKCE